MNERARAGWTIAISSSFVLFAQYVLTAVEEHYSSADPQCPVKGHLS